MSSIFSEDMPLGQKAGLDGQQILAIIDVGATTTPMFKSKGIMLLNEDYTISFLLKYIMLLP